MKITVCSHLIAFLAGFLLDLVLGDPYSLPHPVRWIGGYIAFLEKRLLKEEDSDKKKLMNGARLVVCVTLTTLIIAGVILYLGYYVNVYIGTAIETIMTYQLLATKCLRDESMKVYYALKNEGIEKARKAVSMIVGRDTEVLDEKGVTKAAVETVAENCSDGVIAPMLYLCIGGPLLGFFYKSVNTMDSMVGYKNDKYMFFGRVAARLDDVLNFIPSRITAWLMIFACHFLGKEFDSENAKRIYLRDRNKHKSPNAGQSEAAAAGALSVRLAGNIQYFGIMHEKPFLGDEIREIEYEDIKRVNRLMYMTAVICETICVILIAGVIYLSML